MRLWIDAVLSILFAPTCAACDRVLDHPTRGAACHDCWQSIAPLPSPCCACCGDAVAPASLESLPYCARCLTAPPSVECTRSIGIYDGSLRALVHALKYDGRRSLARPLAALMRERDDGLLALARAAVPVPLHRSKRRERGFNQAEDLARGLGVPLVRALRRVRPTAVQAELSATERQGNVEGAFDATAAITPLVGTTVVLVDDVTTTGATLNACATALRRGGVERVIALTAARAVTKWR